ncbi:TetR/AcrR family transcriptional regulator [Alteribacter keqinensis]|uniref:TetR/AcrR family transcriptional regulator n=1 Tax=Alteribacter keqinensis TaxID=2483800 RepID=A0A3M7TWL5_9BACI|nr:TetR/AcrR family transcriptional regulator [Alteribacter keqinensis]RNA70007.1 TetR/AcrR family transcriptional regulator [Alteribacter keqinensis]
MDGFQQRREQKKHAILETATTLFMKHGIQKVPVSEIAKKAGVSQVTIYNYFDNKHTLVHACFLYYVDQALLEFERIVESDMPFPDKIKQIIFNKKETSQINEEFYHYLMKEYTSGETNYIEKIYVEKAVPYFTQLFEEGKKLGYIDPNLSQEAILFYIKMFKDTMQQEEVYKRVLPLTEDITNIFFYGLFGKREND